MAPLTRTEELRRFLMQDRFANAYLIGNLDDLYQPFCRWWGVRDDLGQLRNVLLVFCLLQSFDGNLHLGGGLDDRLL